MRTSSHRLQVGIISAGAVLATAYVEVGHLLTGQTAFIDGISLRSTVVAPHPQTPADWVVVHGTALVSGSSVKMAVKGTPRWSS